MWWFGRWDSTKGAWDIDMKTSQQYRKRKEGTKAIKQGILGLLIVAIIGYGASLAGNSLDFTNESVFTMFLGGLFMIITFAATVISIFLFLMILIGIYYFIRFFKYSDQSPKKES